MNGGIWILDSASTDHMIPRRDLFTNISPFKGEVTVMASLCNLKGRGLSSSNWQKNVGVGRYN